MKKELLKLIALKGRKAEALADAIIAAGWRKLPVSVGQTVWVLEVSNFNEKHAICPYKVAEIHEREAGFVTFVADKLYSGGGRYSFTFAEAAVGASVFATEADAIKAYLKHFRQYGAMPDYPMLENGKEKFN